MTRPRDPAPEDWPGRRPTRELPLPPGSNDNGPAFADLVAASNFSFLRGASHPRELVERAILLGHAGLGVADRNSVAGVVRAWKTLKDIRAHARDEAEDTAIRESETAEAGEARREAARACLAAFEAFHLVTGARLCFSDGTPDIVAYPVDRAGWGRLTRLLTAGNMKPHVVKGECDLTLADLLAHAEGLVLIAMAGEADEAALRTLAAALPGRLWLGATMPRAGRDRRRLARLAALAERTGLPLLATCDALYATPEDRPVQDIVTCIREGVTLAAAGRRLEANAERHLKPAAEMARLFRDRPEAVAAWRDVLARIDFDLGLLRYEYPHEPVPDGWAPQDWLEHETHRLAAERHPDGLPEKMRALLDEEFRLIRKAGYAYYFLTVYEAVKFARSLNPPILCQGRGSAANSAVCYYLGITSVDPTKHNLLFTRFISEDRNEPPDIDVDFEHERREEVIQHIYQRYGRHRAGIAATVIHYRARSTVREVGKALGLSEDVTANIGRTVWGQQGSRVRGMEEKRFSDAGLDLGNPAVMQLKELVDRLLEAPRHLSQHVGGFILTHDRLDETVPVLKAAMDDRTFIEWDKDDIDALGLMKVDILALGMLTCIRKAFDMMRDAGMDDLTLATVPTDVPAVYDMLCRGDSVGVFQVESRAQINMLPRLRPRRFYDLAVQVAIVRPGPIEGDMVHPYLRRRAADRDGRPPDWTFPTPAPPHDPDELKAVLGETFGVPLFQEQAMKLAIVAAGFSPKRANELRRAMATFRHVGGMEAFEAEMVEGMTKRGYDPDFARRCFEQIRGFGSYGFPESHAISFALLVWCSAWLKCFHPVSFAAALLNSQPMGFYAPAQIVRDAVEHGVEVRPIDVNASGWDNGLEGMSAASPPRSLRACREAFSTAGLDTLDPSLEANGVEGDGMRAPNWSPANPRWGDIVPRNRRDAGFALRLGFRQIDGFREAWGRAIAAERAARGPFADIEELGRRVLVEGMPLPSRALRLLADADACRTLAPSRRDAGWAVRRIPAGELPLFAAARAPELAAEDAAPLPPMPLSEEVAADYQTTRLSLKAHPMAFLRPVFTAEGVLSSAEFDRVKSGRRARVAGVVLVRQRPGKGNAIFATLEDETGIVNIVLWASLFERFRRPLMAARLMEAEGVVQRVKEGPVDVLHLMADRIADRTAELARLSEDHTTRIEAAPGDKAAHPDHHRIPRHRHPRDVRILPGSRDFH